MARQGLEATGYALGLTNANRWLNVFDVAYRNQSDAGVPRRNGYEIEIEIPLFDWGNAKLAKAEAIYRQAVQQLFFAASIGDARSQVRVAYDAYRTTYDVAQHYRDEVVPLRKRIADENQLRYNSMQLSIFELLADAREQVKSVNAALDAQRDFWLADADLQAALGGGGARGIGPSNAFKPAKQRPHRRPTDPTGLDHDDEPSQLLAHCRLDGCCRGRSQSRQRGGATGGVTRWTRRPRSRRSRRRPRAPLQSGGDAQWLDAAVAHERRRERISSGSRAGGA